MEKVNQYLKHMKLLQDTDPLGVVIASSPEQVKLMKTIKSPFETLTYTESNTSAFLQSLASHLEAKTPLVFVQLEDVPTHSLNNYLVQLRDHRLTDFALGNNGDLGIVKNQATSIILWVTPEQFALLPNEVFGAVCNLIYSA